MMDPKNAAEFKPSINVERLDEEAREVAHESAKTGFLPIVTNWFDRLFISAVIWVALSLFWMRFLEPSIPLMGAHVIALVLGAAIILKG